MAKKLIAEFIGTFALVFLAVGAAVSGIGLTREESSSADVIVPAAGIVGVALAFGLVLMALCYAIGHISGCHVNPAVTLSFLVTKRIGASEAIGYFVAQILGAIVAGGALKLMVSSFGVVDKTGGLGTNAYGDNITMGGAFFFEAIITAFFVYIILRVTDKGAIPAMAGVAIGFALTVVHIIGIPLTGTSVNPARSFGPALFEGGTAMSQVWLFIAAPLVGGLIAAVIWMVTRDKDAEEASAAEPATV